MEDRMSPAEASACRRAEWTAGRPGRLGRLLHAEVELYLAFFAVAHED